MSAALQLSLHHVGYVVAEIAPVAEQYVSRYCYEVSSAVVHDPIQTSFVQFLRLGGDRVYLELVAPDGPGSKLGNAVRRGGKLHHLCYAVERFEDTLPQLEGSGMLLIGQPAPAVAFAGRRICWLIDESSLLVELVERRDAGDPCEPGIGDNEAMPDEDSR